MICSVCDGLNCRGETIVKEGLSLEFATILFQTWFKEKGKSHVGGALRKAGIENRLLVSCVESSKSRPLCVTNLRIPPG